MTSKSLTDKFSTLRQFSGKAPEFWQAYVGALREFSRCDSVEILFQQKNQQGESVWKSTLVLPQGQPSLLQSEPSFPLNGESLTDIKIHEKSESFRVTFPIETGLESAVSLGVLNFNTGTPPAEFDATQLHWINDIPASFQKSQQQKSRPDAAKHLEFSTKLMSSLRVEKKFKSAAHHFCDQIAKEFGSHRVALAWHESPYLKMVCFSDTVKLNQSMNAVEELEKTMEECLDQNNEVVWPELEQGLGYGSLHGKYAQANSIPFLLSMPLRHEGEVQAVCHLQRSSRPFGDHEMTSLRVISDQCFPILRETRERDRWIGSKASMGFKNLLGKCLGHEHSLSKLLIILLSLAILTSLFWKVEYRTEASFILKSRKQAMLPAPFEGFIQRVNCRVGDAVKAGDVLLQLDPSQLSLRAAELSATIERFRNEARKHRGEGKQAEMKIALARAEQSLAEHKLIQYQLEKSKILAPLDAFVVDGRHHEHLGAPVQEGDILFRLAQLDPLDIELEIPERQVHELQDGLTGQIAFASRPELGYDFIIKRIEPAATQKERRNLFLARAEFQSPSESWWRPGMTGLAKIPVGKRPLAWIITHNLIDYLRLLLWW